MSQTDAPLAAPVLPKPPVVPGAYTPDNLPVPPPPAGMPTGMPPRRAPDPPTTQEVDRQIAQASSVPEPKMETPENMVVELPAGFISPEDGGLYQRATVRELNGFDEETLSRLSLFENPAVYVTKMLMLGVEDLAGRKPTIEDIRSLLIGDRDALIVGVRIATYGKDVEFKIKCGQCDVESIVAIDLYEDVPTTKMEDPLKRRFTIDLHNGVAEVVLLNGAAQESFSGNLSKKTLAEIRSLMLAKSVVSINGVPTYGGEDHVRRLSTRDRQTIMDFLDENQPGPDLNGEITGECSHCGEKYPFSLALPSLFRF